MRYAVRHRGGLAALDTERRTTQGAQHGTIHHKGRARRTRYIVAAVVLVLSFVPDIALLASGMTGATVATVGVLMLMHVIAAAITVGMVTTLARD